MCGFFTSWWCHSLFDTPSYSDNLILIHTFSLSQSSFKFPKQHNRHHKNSNIHNAFMSKTTYKYSKVLLIYKCLSFCGKNMFQSVCLVYKQRNCIQVIVNMWYVPSNILTRSYALRFAGIKWVFWYQTRSCRRFAEK